MPRYLHLVASLAALAMTCKAATAAAPSTIVSADPVSVKGLHGAIVMRITAPQNGENLPVLVFAHGAALNRSDYRPLVEALARAGYIVVQPDFPDASADGIAPKAWPADTWRIRFDAVTWIGTHLPDVLKTIPGLARRADLTRTAIAGHSFGGHTAALAMGALVEGMSAQPALPYRAAVLLSAPGNWDGLTPAWKARADYLKVDWTPMRGPVLMVNGTADTGPMSDLGAVWHDDGFNRTAHNACLMHVEGAGHYLGGIDSALRPPVGDTTAERRASVFGATISFLDQALGRATDAARKWPGIRSTLACK